MILWPGVALAKGPSVAAKVSEVQPLLIGQLVPDAKILDLGGKEVSLKKIVTEKPTVLVVFRGGWCPYCRVQLGQLGQVKKTLESLGWQLVGISADPVSLLRETTKEEALSYRLFSDERALATTALDVQLFGHRPKRP